MTSFIQTRSEVERQNSNIRKLEIQILKADNERYKSKDQKSKDFWGDLLISYQATYKMRTGYYFHYDGRRI